MSRNRYRVVEFPGTDGMPRWAVHGVEHDDAGKPVKLLGEAMAVAFPDDGVAPADSLRGQLQVIMSALDEPIVQADGLAKDEPATT